MKPSAPQPPKPVKVSCTPAQAAGLLELFEHESNGNKVVFDGLCGRAVRQAIVLLNLRGQPPGVKMVMLPEETARNLAIVVAKVPKTLKGEELLGPFLDQLQGKT